MRVHIFFDESTDEGRDAAAYWQSLPQRSRSAAIAHIISEYINGPSPVPPKKKEEERPSVDEEKKAEATPKKKNKKSSEREMPEETMANILSGLSRF